ncbi:hypothetical protein DCO58_06350 [Helicobacter saguini]|uniref:Uncharacterized protein n=1 Tax=Helicobacter saguini TaxID=1548018 RepID=A0A347VWG1_9HELI|nr:glycosyltransferase family 9 protein [Helicobacter saguini]MWV62039.1 hypothetical protein [Helicobacter saguini]MWV67288.1 hypothetical protein [Helicobacter saguini]MWV69641.1 hypothetical protein [Helicobacter saguini]MWV70808.1 hypothetical protein [Helicobacter saguini]TLD94351.1 hypothetical protein LS64_006460 [Helicobacter saguini]
MQKVSKNKTLRVGFIHHYAVGDNVRMLKPLFLLKYLYNAEVVVFGNALMCKIARNLDYVDYCEDIESLDFKDIPLINSYHLDYVVLTNCRTKFVKVLDSTNIKHFFTRTKLNSFFSKKGRTIFINQPCYRGFNDVDIICEYVKKINPKLAHERLKSISQSEIDSKTKLQTNAENKENISKFFNLVRDIFLIRNILENLGGGENIIESNIIENIIFSKLDSKNTNIENLKVIESKPPDSIDSKIYSNLDSKIPNDFKISQNSYLEFSIDSISKLDFNLINSNISNFLNKNIQNIESKYYLIGVNPFNHSAWASFTLENYVKIIANLCEFPHVLVFVMTYPNVHKNLINVLNGTDSNTQKILKNLIILQNNNDIFNLVEFISHLSLLISPSSGPIHIATNLQVPTLGIYSRKDTKKWATRDKRYVILSKDTNKISQKENANAMQQVLDITQNLINTNKIERKNLV